MRILLVEDDRQTAAFIVKGLRQEGFAVDLAPDGEDGLHLALTEPYDAAVLDIRLIREQPDWVRRGLASRGDRGLVRFANRVLNQRGEAALEYNPLRLLKRKPAP